MAVDLFSIGPFTVHGYGLMIAIGMIAALFLADYRAGKRGLNGDYVWHLSVLIMVIGWMGGKLMYCIVDWKEIVKDPSSIISSSGFVVFGGIITGVLTALVYCRLRKISFREYADIIVPEVSLAQGIGRIGCFLAGCCYGKETDAWFGVIFNHSPYAPYGVKVIPTQLISSIGNLIIFAVLLAFAARSRIRGHVLALYLMLYSAGRFSVEFLRGDPRGSVGPFSTSQFIAIFIFITGLALWVIFSRMAPPVAQEITGETEEAGETEAAEANEPHGDPDSEGESGSDEEPGSEEEPGAEDEPETEEESGLAGAFEAVSEVET